jgi:hypothetical protein
MNSLTIVSPFVLQDYIEKLNQTQKSLEILNNELSIHFQDIGNSISAQNTCLDNYNIRFVKKDETLRLNDDILAKVFCCNSLDDIFRVSTTCKRWNALIEKPLFLHNWLQINNEIIFKSCEKLPSENRRFYQKSFLLLERIDKKIFKIGTDQKNIFKLNVFTIVALSPFLIKGIGHILHGMHVNMQNNMNTIIAAYLENNPGATLREAELHYLQELVDLCI